MNEQIVPNMPQTAAQMADLIGLLAEAGAEAARSAARSTFRAIDKRVGGKKLSATEASAPADNVMADATPLWNVLASAIDKALKQPGSRARVARYLGVPRQRITDYTKGRRIPDAEIALRLLHWLAATRAGQDPSFLVPPPETTATPPAATDAPTTSARP